MTQNFLELSCFEDPLRKTSFPQNWTVYYWAYWMVWCVAAPFFIGSISKGRTIKQTIFCGYLFGTGSTLVSFIILGNYSMGLQMTGKIDFCFSIAKQTISIQQLFQSLKLSLSAIDDDFDFNHDDCFYATSFDSIALTASGYGCRNLKENEKPPVSIQLLWCVLLIILPISLLFSKVQCQAFKASASLRHFRSESSCC